MLRKKGGRGLVNIEDCIHTSIQGLEDYTKSKERLIITDSNRIGNKTTTTTTQPGNRNGKNNNCMDDSSDKLARKHECGYLRERISFHGSTK